MLKKIKKWILFNFFNVCPICGGKLEAVEGWQMDECQKCGKKYKYNNFW